MSKRRVFDIEFDEADLEGSVPAGTEEAPAPETRRGPMAAAITENADALAARQQHRLNLPAMLPLPVTRAASWETVPAEADWRHFAGTHESIGVYPTLAGYLST